MGELSKGLWVLSSGGGELEVGVDVLVQAGCFAQQVAVQGDKGDHRGIVGGKGGRGDEELKSVGVAGFLHGVAQGQITRDSSGEGDGGFATLLSGAHGFGDQDFDHGGLE